jgi:hypothetical protein
VWLNVITQVTRIKLLEMDLDDKTAVGHEALRLGRDTETSA